MEAVNFQDVNLSFPIDNFQKHYRLVLHLNSMQAATENCHYPEKNGKPLRLELNFTFPLEHVTKLFILGERKSLVAVDKFCAVRKNI